MKKINLLLFLICILFQTSYVTAGNAEEKIDLSPKIKEGDSWKMIINVSIDTASVNFHYSAQTDSFPIPNSKSLDKCFYKSAWKVDCLSATKDKIELKYTLLQLKAQVEGIFPNAGVVLFNDTDYPITEEDLNTNKYLGKSFDYTLEFFDGVGRSKIENSQFDEKKMILSTFNIANDSTANNFSVKFDQDLYNAVGPDIVNVFTTYSYSVFPGREIDVHDKWNSKIEININDSILSEQLNFELIEQEDNAFLIDGGQQGTFILEKSRGIALTSSNNTAYIYDFPGINNTNISGDFSEILVEGNSKLDFVSPAGVKDTIIRIENGQFNFGLDLKEPVFAYLRLKSKIACLYIRPGMHVHLKWEEKERLPTITGIGAKDMEFMMQNFRVYPPNEYQPYDSRIFRDIKNWRKEVSKQFSEDISPDCVDFLTQDFIYQKGFFMVHSMMNYGPDKDYLSYVNSIPLLHFNASVLPDYNLFIREYLVLKQKLLKKQFGGIYNENNLTENIDFARIFYKGYPRYFTEYHLLEKALLEKEILEVQPYYDEFMLLPINDLFKNNLQQRYTGVEKIEKGDRIPVSSFVDSESGMYKLPEEELTIIDINVYEYSSYNFVNWNVHLLYRGLTDEDRVKRINLVKIVPANSRGVFEENKGNEKLKIKYIYLPKDQLKTLDKLELNNQRRCFLLGPDLKIRDNNFDFNHFTKALDDYCESKDQPIIKADTRRLLLIILISLVCFSFLSWLIIRLRTQKISKREAAKRKLSELELRAIRSQMNPHFMFNALNSIQNLVNKSEIEESNIYLSEFAEMMRLVLNNSEKQLVPLEEEIKLIESYLELEKLRIPFEFEITIDPGIHPEEEEIPGMLIQPFVENAVLHGIAPQKGGKVKVVFTKIDHKICCEITDNGIGISKRSEQRNGNGKAIKMMEERIKIVNSQTTEMLTFEVIDRNEMNEEGTLVRIEIPV